MEELRHHSAFAFDEEVEGYVGAQFMHEICSGLDQEDALDAHIVRTALKQLSDKQQRRFRLFFYYGYSENEIARIEGVSQPAVHDSIQAGLKRLKYMLNW
jgi:DNA-directed RNA polymerase specialized sigma24 family protein